MSERLKGEAHVKRVDGKAYSTLVTRFRVKGFPSFYLIYEGKVWAFNGARTHEGLVKFVRTRGEFFGKRLDMVGGPLNPYWSVVTLLFHVTDRIFKMALPYRDSPMQLVIMIIAALVCSLIMLAVIIHFLTQPKPLNRRATSHQPNAPAPVPAPAPGHAHAE